jgi:haloacetate dehalogenase
LTRGDAANAETPPAIWKRSFAPDVADIKVSSGHFIPEEAPEATVAALLPFLRAGDRGRHNRTPS